MIHNKSKDQLDIFQGLTLSNFFTGLVVIATGVMLFIAKNYWLGLPIAYTGIWIFLSLKGVRIDSKRQRIKSYHYIFPIKVGIWKDLSTFKMLKLGVTNTSQVMNSRGTTTTVRTKSFDVSLMDKDDSTLELKEFDNYECAKMFLQEISESLKIPVSDYYKQMHDN